MESYGTAFIGVGVGALTGFLVGYSIEDPWVARLFYRLHIRNWAPEDIHRASWVDKMAGVGVTVGGAILATALLTLLTPDPPVSYGGVGVSIRGKGVLSWEDSGCDTCYSPGAGGHLFDAIISHPRRYRSELR